MTDPQIPSFWTRVQQVQQTLNAPKDLWNDFSKFKYRSNEAILEKVKPLLATNQLVLIQSDHLVNIGGENYIEAIATLHDELSDLSVQATAYAREPKEKKGMDAAQISGAASSYARKYALNGLFLIDDSKDSDDPSHYIAEPVAQAAIQGSKAPAPARPKPAPKSPPARPAGPPPARPAAPARPAGPPTRRPSGMPGPAASESQKNYIIGLAKQAGFVKEDGHHDREALDVWLEGLELAPVDRLTSEQAKTAIDELQKFADGENDA